MKSENYCAGQSDLPCFCMLDYIREIDREGKYRYSNSDWNRPEVEINAK